MVQAYRGLRVAIAVALLAPVGCMHGDHHRFGPDRATAANIAVPPADAVPR